MLGAGKTSLKKKIQFLTSWSLQTSEKYIYIKQMVDQMAVIVISSTEKQHDAVQISITEC